MLLLKRLVVTASFSWIAFFDPAVVMADGPGAPPQPATSARSSAQFTLHRDEAGGPDAGLARKRARAGDCRGALAAFDAAIRVTIEPTLRRDRGLCHEKLGSPFPAIDDYRAYLAVRADAPDAAAIAARLASLEDSVRADAAASSTGASEPERENGVRVGGSLSVGTPEETREKPSSSSLSLRTDARAAATAGAGGTEPNAGGGDRSFDEIAAEERLRESAHASPLRDGTGFSAGAFLLAPRFFLGSQTGISKDSGFAFGATVRYSWSPTFTLLAELGYAGLGTSGQASSVGGPLLFAGVEARVPLDRFASNQVVLGLGPNFERYTAAGAKGALVFVGARARAGYRHIFGPSFGLELMVDGGPIYAKVEGFDGATGAVVGGSVAVVIGF